MGTCFRALALDLDGTLLDPRGELPASCANGLRRAVACGVGVYLVSGRMQPAMWRFAETLGLSTPLVGYNGAKIQKFREPPLFEAFLARPAAENVVEYCLRHGQSLNLYFADRLYVLRDEPLARRYSRYFQVPFQVLPSPDALPSGNPNKLLISLDKENDPVPVIAALKEVIGAEGELTSSTGDGRYVEILPPGVNKAAAIRRLAAADDIPLSAWVAAGDGLNDWEMLNLCGAGLFVENGNPELVASARRTVAPLYAGGLELVLREFFGI